MLYTAAGIYLTGAVREWRKNKHAETCISAEMDRFGSGFSSLDAQRVY